MGASCPVVCAPAFPRGCSQVAAPVPHPSRWKLSLQIGLQEASPGGFRAGGEAGPAASI